MFAQHLDFGASGVYLPYELESHFRGLWQSAINDVRDLGEREVHAMPQVLKARIGASDPKLRSVGMHHTSLSELGFLQPVLRLMP